jgi:drug/metabolite transporter (DMT)-like permease
MKQIFTDFVDDIRCIQLTGKGWNYVATLLLVLAGWYWMGLCNNGAFFQLTGCAFYMIAGCIWAAKTEWAKKFWERIDEGEEYVEFDEE